MTKGSYPAVEERFQAFLRQLKSPELDPVDAEVTAAYENGQKWKRQALELETEVERLREVIAQMDAEWVDPAENERLREALKEIHELYGGKRAGLIAWAALCYGGEEWS